MMDYTVTKDMSAAQVKKAAKEAVMQDFLEFLQEKYGEAAIVRIASAQSTGKNILAAKLGTVEQDGTAYDLCAKIDISVPEWEDVYSSKSGELWRQGFLFDVARDAYLAWVEQQTEKARAAAEKKEKKIKADAAMRAKKKGGGE